TGVLRHPSGEYLQERMRLRNLCASLGCFRRLRVVFQFSVIDESQTVVKPPVFRVVPNAKLGQRDGVRGIPGSVGRLGRKEVAAKLVSRKQSRIQLCGDFQQRRKQMKVVGMLMVLVAKILNRPRPVEIRNQSGVSETNPL